MEYIEVEDAIDEPGLRLVLTGGVPGPWGEAAKGILRIKKIDYLPVRQNAAQVSEALRSWTGQLSAPVAMFDDERPRSGWAEILMLAEQLEASPRLIPADPRERALMLGLCFEICGEEGLGWSRRLMLLPSEDHPGRDTMAWKFGVSSSDPADAERRVEEVLALLSGQLASQREAGSRFFIGDSLTAVDVYWAAFSNLIQPLDAARSPMPDYIRGAYGSKAPAPDPALIEHRDFVFEEYLGLPQEF